MDRNDLLLLLVGVLSFFSSKISVINRVLLVSEIPVGHKEGKNERHDGESSRNNGENLHHVVVRCSGTIIRK